MFVCLFVLFVDETGGSLVALIGSNKQGKAKANKETSTNKQTDKQTSNTDKPASKSIITIDKVPHNVITLNSFTSACASLGLFDCFLVVFVCLFACLLLLVSFFCVARFFDRGRFGLVVCLFGCLLVCLFVCFFFCLCCCFVFLLVRSAGLPIALDPFGLKGFQ